MEEQLLDSNKRRNGSLGGSKVAIAGGSSEQMSRGAKILAVKNKQRFTRREMQCEEAGGRVMISCKYPSSKVWIGFVVDIF